MASRKQSPHSRGYRVGKAVLFEAQRRFVEQVRRALAPFGSQERTIRLFDQFDFAAAPQHRAETSEPGGDVIDPEHQTPEE
jgi:hypothetical protein